MIFHLFYAPIGETTLPVAHLECGCLQTGRGSLVLHGHQVCPQGIAGCIELCQLRLLPLQLVLRPNITNEDRSQISLRSVLKPDHGSSGFIPMMVSLTMPCHAMQLFAANMKHVHYTISTTCCSWCESNRHRADRQQVSRQCVG